MDNRIGIGLIVGLVSTTTLYVVSSDKFSKIQKVFLCVFIIFPPLQWLSILGILIVSHYKDKSSQGKISNMFNNPIKGNYDRTLDSLRELRKKELLTEEEYLSKLKSLEDSKLNSQLVLTDEYKRLKALFKDKILTNPEFEDKISVLKDRLRKYSDIKFIKKGEGHLKQIGKYTLYDIRLKDESVLNNIHLKVSDGTYFIKKDGEIIYYKNLEDLFMDIRGY